MKKMLVATGAAALLLVPAAIVLPASADTATPAPAATQLATQDQLAQIDATIAGLKEKQQKFPDADYGKEIQDTINTAMELRGMIEAILSGQMPAFDPMTIQARVQLVAQIGETIHVATTQLTTKVERAHVEIGFACARAALRLINLSASPEQLTMSSTELATTLKQAQSYPELGPDDTATIYVKGALDKAIWDTRTQRDSTLLGKAPSTAYQSVNRSITKAVGVQLKLGATVKEVQDAIANLHTTYSAALAQVG